MYILSNLQDEEIPTQGFKFDGSDENKTLEQVLAEYYQSHPSIIDKLFTGKFTYALIALGMQKTIVTCGSCNK
jgi:hypothetical protein